MTDSQHWYRRDGTPCHWQDKADGSGQRATTLRDARKLGLVPSFSTVDSIRSKYQLNRWIVTQALIAARGIDPEPYEDAEEYAQRVQAHLDETAGQRLGSDEGTAIHDSIESVCKGGDPTPGYESHTEAALNEVASLFPDVEDWVSEKTFANPMGFGGMCDLHSPSTGILVDFKTKDFELDADGQPVRPDTGKKYRLDYDQYIQIATYQRGLMLPANVGANVFVSRCQPGAVTSRVWSLDELAKGWDMFQHEFGLWVLDKQYDPSYSPTDSELVA